MNTSQVTLGRMRPVDVRTLWQIEAGDFTPWLATEENLMLLGETVGLELELEAQEKNVGPFRADILCREAESGDWVLIENQLERTNHAHLGQLLTYAAGLDAVTIVWIADRFNEEHRATLDWLNEITGERFSFFGLEIELWQIGDSAVAPKFNVVCRPNEWTTGGGAPGPKDGTRLEYWETFRDYVLSNTTELTPRKARAKASLRFNTDRKKVDLTAGASRMAGGRLTVSLAVRGKDAQQQFDSLRLDKDAIEADLEAPVEWIERPSRNIYRIRMTKPGHPDNKDEWPEQHRWLLESLLLFQRVFKERIALLPHTPETDVDTPDEHSDEE
jgi:hypothetical protein